MTIQELAQQYQDLFISKKRKNEDKFLCLDDSVSEDHPIKQLIYKAHDNMMPDDYKYQFIHDALELIANCECDDYCDCISNIECDVYNSALLDWVSSNLTRIGYCDEALAEHNCSDFIEIIQYGQIKEKEEVFNSVKQSLEEIINNENNK